MYRGFSPLFCWSAQKESIQSGKTLSLCCSLIYRNHHTTAMEYCYRGRQGCKGRSNLCRELAEVFFPKRSPAWGRICLGSRDSDPVPSPDRERSLALYNLVYQWKAALSPSVWFRLSRSLKDCQKLWFKWGRFAFIPQFFLLRAHLTDLIGLGQLWKSVLSSFSWSTASHIDSSICLLGNSWDRLCHLSLKKQLEFSSDCMIHPQRTWCWLLGIHECQLWSSSV